MKSAGLFPGDKLVHPSKIGGIHTAHLIKSRTFENRFKLMV